MADETIESTAIDGLQGTELMGRPLRINKAEPEVLEDLVEEEEVVMAAVITVGTMVVVMAAVITVGTMVAVMAAVITVGIMVAVMAAVITVGTMVAVMEAVITAGAIMEVILKLIILLTVNPLEQMVGKIEVMEILLKTLNTRVVGLEEKGVSNEGNVSNEEN